MFTVGCAMHCATFAARLVCDNTTPFGSPVVPLEYGSTNVDSGATEAGVGGRLLVSGLFERKTAVSEYIYLMRKLTLID